MSNEIKKISCTTIMSNKDINNLKKGIGYLRIVNNISLNTEVYIELSDFESKYRTKSYNATSSLIYNNNILSHDSLPCIEPYESRDFNPRDTMNYIAEKLELREEINDVKSITIESDFGNFLELPWEEIVEEGKLIVIRKVIKEEINTKSDVNSNCNLLLVLSHADSSSNGVLEHMDKEILNILDNILKCPPKNTKFDNIHILKHTTKNLFEAFDWSIYNYIHLIMHGDENNGGLLLESSFDDYYKNPDLIVIDEIMEKLKNYNFQLFFLNCCYSAASLSENKNSIVFNIVKNNIAKYSIGYRAGIKDNIASEFARIFYETMSSKKDTIDNIYIYSVEKLLKSSLASSDQIPILFL